MALTITAIKRVHVPAGRALVADITFDSSYPTGGEPLTPADLGMTSIEWLEAKQKGLASRLAAYDYANAKLVLFTAIGAEAANASDQSTIVVRAFAIGDQQGIASV